MEMEIKAIIGREDGKKMKLSQIQGAVNIFPKSSILGAYLTKDNKLPYGEAPIKNCSRDNLYICVSGLNYHAFQRNLEELNLTLKDWNIKRIKC